LFCRVIEKREEHQRNVQIHTIPETVPTKLVADFMIYKHTLSNEEKVDPTYMKGYNYLVNDEEGNVKVVPPLPKIVLYYR
jgi:hypothetical protein